MTGRPSEPNSVSDHHASGGGSSLWAHHTGNSVRCDQRSAQRLLPTQFHGSTLPVRGATAHPDLTHGPAHATTPWISHQPPWMTSSNLAARRNDAPLPTCQGQPGLQHADSAGGGVLQPLLNRLLHVWKGSNPDLLGREPMPFLGLDIGPSRRHMACPSTKLYLCLSPRDV